MSNFTVNALFERDGKSFAIGDEFDPTGMKMKDVRLLVNAGVLLPVGDDAQPPVAMVEEDETWHEQL
jgi:hypothetical protein